MSSSAALRQALEALQGLVVPTTPATDGSNAMFVDSDELDSYLAERDEHINRMDRAVDQLLASNGSASAPMQGSVPPPVEDLDSLGDDPQKLRAALRVYKSRCEMIESEALEAKKQLAVYKAREDALGDNWARKMLQRGPGTCDPMHDAMPIASSLGLLPPPDGSSVAAGDASGNGAVSDQEKVLAGHIIDRTFDDHKKLLRDRLAKATQELEKFQSGEVFREMQSKIVVQQEEIRALRSSLGGAEDRITELRVAQFEKRRSEPALPPPPPTTTQPAASTPGADPLLLMKLMQGQMLMARMMNHSAVMAALREAHADASLEAVGEAITDATDEMAVVAAAAAQGVKLPPLVTSDGSPIKRREESKPDVGRRIHAAGTTRSSTTTKAPAKSDVPKPPTPPDTTAHGYGVGGSSISSMPIRSRRQSQGGAGGSHGPVPSSVVRLAK